jgi:hypothetical protein
VENIHDPFYNPVRMIFLEKVSDISPTTPSMFEWEQRGYEEGAADPLPPIEPENLFDYHPTVKLLRLIWQQ